MSERRVELEKVGSPSHVFTWTYTSLSREIAVRRAFKALARDFPGEDPVLWREKPPVKAAA